jgi:hypothetical protein
MCSPLFALYAYVSITESFSEDKRGAQVINLWSSPKVKRLSFTEEETLN